MSIEEHDYQVCENGAVRSLAKAEGCQKISLSRAADLTFAFFVIPLRRPSMRTTRPCRTLPSKPYAASFLWRAPRSTGTRSWATRLARRCRTLRKTERKEKKKVYIDGEHNRQTQPPSPPSLLTPTQTTLHDWIVVLSLYRKLKYRGQRKVWSHQHIGCLLLAKK